MTSGTVVGFVGTFMLYAVAGNGLEYFPEGMPPDQLIVDVEGPVVVVPGSVVLVVDVVVVVDDVVGTVVLVDDVVVVDPGPRASAIGLDASNATARPAATTWSGARRRMTGSCHAIPPPSPSPAAAPRR